jgi:hypothetical protein
MDDRGTIHFRFHSITEARCASQPTFGTLAMEVFMRSRLVSFTLSFCLTLALLGCTSKPSPVNNANDTSQTTDTKGAGQAAKEVKREPLVVPAGTAVTINLASALGSKLSQPGQTFDGTVARDIVINNVVAIPKGASVSGTVTDAKPLGRFAGGAVLQVRLDSINNMPVRAAVRTFSAKGKGKRTAVLAGGGAALGGIIGGLAGGGKGVAIGALAGGGAGGAGAAFTGNKDIVLPAEAAVSFQLTEPLELR